jgi:hypothetical protein
MTPRKLKTANVCPDCGSALSADGSCSCGTGQEEGGCCCGGFCFGDFEPVQVKILDRDESTCQKMEQAAMTALRAMDLDAAVEHLTEAADFKACGITKTPALIIDDALVASGRLLTSDEVLRFLQDGGY